MKEPLNNHKPRHIGIVVPTVFELAPLLEIMPQLTQTSVSPWQIYSAQLSGINRREVTVPEIVSVTVPETVSVTVTVIISFIGPANAAAATEHLISLKPDIILHGGAAGAINESLLPGDIVLGAASKIICSKEVLEVRKTLLMATTSIRYLKDGAAVRLDQLDGDSDLISQALTLSDKLKAKFASWNGPGWPEQMGKKEPQMLSGVVGSLDGWTKGKDQLDFVRENFAVDAEDMESAYIAQIAAIHGVPNLAIRAISNNEYLQTLAKDEIIPAVQEAAKRVAFIMKELIQRSIT